MSGELLIERAVNIENSPIVGAEVADRAPRSGIYVNRAVNRSNVEQRQRHVLRASEQRPFLHHDFPDVLHFMEQFVAGKLFEERNRFIPELILRESVMPCLESRVTSLLAGRFKAAYDSDERTFEQKLLPLLENLLTKHFQSSQTALLPYVADALFSILPLIAPEQKRNMRSFKDGKFWSAICRAKIGHTNPVICGKLAQETGIWLFMDSIQDVTAPFFLPGAGERAFIMVMMVHSFTGSPLEFRRLGNFLNGHGYSVSAVRLPGHGTSLKDMSKTRWSDWWNHIVSAYEEFSSSGIKKIVTIGHSMGGLLTLKLAMEKKVDGMICISTPIFIQKRIAFAEVLSQWLRKTKTEPTVPVNAEAFYYDKPPLTCLLSLWSLLKSVKRSLPEVNTPIFISQGRKDQVVQPRSADYIFASTSSTHKKINYYPNSSHSILLDSERDQLHADIYHFLNAILG